MKHFLIYANVHKDRDLTVTRHIRRYLEQRGQRVTVITDGRQNEDTEDDISAAAGTGSGLPGDVECMIVLGGDGTVLQAVRDTVKLHIPIIGVNMGTLGYMTEIEPSGLEEALERLLAGEYGTESRMMLEGRTCFLQGGTHNGWALNDIVISRKGSLQMIQFAINVNGQFLNSYNADGMIVTTPTGSTGYNLSAGGPLVEPGARLIMLTPICPHTLNQRSIILSPEDVIEIEIPECRKGGIQTVEANFDGSNTISLQTGDKIRVMRSEMTTEFIRLNQVSFLEILHRKMQA